MIKSLAIFILSYYDEIGTGKPHLIQIQRGDNHEKETVWCMVMHNHFSNNAVWMFCQYEDGK